MSIEEQINELINRMYNVGEGYEFEREDKYGIHFLNLSNTLCHLTLDDWDDVQDFVEENEDRYH